MHRKVCSLCVVSSVVVLSPISAASAQRLEGAIQPTKETVQPDGWERSSKVGASTESGGGEVAAASKKERRPRVRVEVDLSELDVSEGEREAAERIREEVVSRSQTLLLQEGFDVVWQEEDATVEVHLRTKDRDTFLQGLWVVVKMDGEEVKGEELSEMECAYCTNEDLAKQTVTVLIPAALEVVKKKLEEKKAKASTPVTNGTKPKNGNHQQANGKQPPTNGQKDTPEPKPLKGPRPLQVGGWVATGVGAATLGAGIGLWVKGKEVDIDPDFTEELTGKDYKTPGTVMVGVGAALLISGIAMVAVDCVQAKRAREEAKKKRVQVFPAMSRTSFGIGLTSRF